VARILEVNHKMNIERSAQDEFYVWSAISDCFECGLEYPDERSLYEVLVFSSVHDYSVRRCISEARDEGRAMREHISEEMWVHLNRTHLELAPLGFEDILSMGRSEFNRRIEVFADALHGLADDTMIRGESWAFLRIGKLSERSSMICRILEVKRKSITSGDSGAPIDVHQWQALLRCLSGYEPYRRAYDARIVPERVLEFVLQRADFPRSLTCTLDEMRRAIDYVSGTNPLQRSLDGTLAYLLEELRLLNPKELIANQSFEFELARTRRSCEEVSEDLDLAYFTSLRPTSMPIMAASGATLVPQ
jgi:uncharacterized alpha-E superfamily protein